MTLCLSALDAGGISSRVGNLRKGPYLVRKKNPSVIWILNAQTTCKYSIEGF